MKVPKYRIESAFHQKREERRRKLRSLRWLLIGYMVAGGLTIWYIFGRG